jgi:hypothetical protein
MDALKKSTAAVVESTAAAIEPMTIAKPAADNADPFANLSELRLSQAFIQSAGAKKLLTRCRCVSQISRTGFAFTLVWIIGTTTRSSN